jgi:O-antigen ligase
MAVAATWMVAGDAIRARAIKTRDQVSVMWAQRAIGSRSVLYRDTWSMARKRILFGWGMGSFPTVFALYNSQVSKVDRIPIVYHDAHSDWIQSVAEIGLAGTAMIGAAVLLPVLAVRRAKLTPIPFFLFFGALLTGLYAWIEFPFGNVAVVLAWWLCFFSAIQYLRLTAAGNAELRP